MERKLSGIGIAVLMALTIVACATPEQSDAVDESSLSEQPEVGGEETPSGWKQLAITQQMVCALDHGGAATCFGQHLLESISVDIDEPVTALVTLRRKFIAVGESGAIYLWSPNTRVIESRMVGLRASNTVDYEKLDQKLPFEPTYSQDNFICGTTGDRVRCARILTRRQPSLDSMLSSRNFSSWSGQPGFECGVTLAGELLCKGENRYGRLARSSDGDEDRRPDGERKSTSIALPGDSPPASVRTSGEHVCATTRDGKLYCWGRNHMGQAGFDGCSTIVKPREVELPSAVEQIVLETDTTCARLEGGSVRCWGDIEGPRRRADAVRPRQAPERTRGPGERNGCERGEIEPTAKKSIDSPELSDLVIAGDTFCGITRDDEITCWGDITGLDARHDSTGVRFDSLHREELPAAVTHFAMPTPDETCILFENGALTCDIDRTQYANEKGVELFDSPRGELPTTLYRGLSASTRHICLISEDGELSCLGSNQVGQLGVGRDVFETHQPTEIDLGGPVSNVDAGPLHTCAVREDGELHCWGFNSAGQIGTGSRIAWTPRKIEIDAKIVEVAAGRTHTCVLDEDGDVWCWGGNHLGQLGRGDDAATSKPTKVELNADIADLTVSPTGTCALTEEGDVWCWGGFTDSKMTGTTPRAVALDSPATSIEASIGMGCALTENAEMLCWGAGLGKDVRKLDPPYAPEGLCESYVGSCIFAQDKPTYTFFPDGRDSHTWTDEPIILEKLHPGGGQ